MSRKMLKKMRVKRSAIVFGVLTLVVMVAIWMFSAQSAEGSSGLSGGLAEIVMKMPVIGDILSVDGVEAVLRKLAHGWIYMMLGVTMVGMFRGLCSEKKALVLTIVFGFLYAVTDEIHQCFVPGRGPNVRDVLIDACGVVVGSVICLWIYRGVVKKRGVRGFLSKS